MFPEKRVPMRPLILSWLVFSSLEMTSDWPDDCYHCANTYSRGHNYSKIAVNKKGSFIIVCQFYDFANTLRFFDSWCLGFSYIINNVHKLLAVLSQTETQYFVLCIMVRNQRISNYPGNKRLLYKRRQDWVLFRVLYLEGIYSMNWIVCFKMCYDYSSLRNYSKLKLYVTSRFLISL